jgi:hypothetical protein
MCHSVEIAKDVYNDYGVATWTNVGEVWQNVVSTYEKHVVQQQRRVEARDAASHKALSAAALSALGTIHRFCQGLFDMFHCIC